MWLGLDLSKTARWENIMKKHPDRLSDIFTQEEIEHCRKKGPRAAESFAGLWAAREAAAKALGTGFSGAGWKDAFLTWTESGQPVLHLSGVLKERADRQGIRDWSVSISHEEGVAAAVVVMTGGTR